MAAAAAAAVTRPDGGGGGGERRRGVYGASWRARHNKQTAPRHVRYSCCYTHAPTHTHSWAAVASVRRQGAVCQRQLQRFIIPHTFSVCVGGMSCMWTPLEIHMSSRFSVCCLGALSHLLPFLALLQSLTFDLSIMAMGEASSECHKMLSTVFLKEETVGFRRAGCHLKVLQLLLSKHWIHTIKEKELFVQRQFTTKLCTMHLYANSSTGCDVRLVGLVVLHLLQ